MNFSQEQKSAFLHVTGPALVLAGPGSGKTRVIVQRLLNLLKLNPSARILSLTFSKAAATEMQQRFNQLSSKEYPSLHFSTLHSLGFAILRRGWSGSAFPGLVNTQKLQVMKKIFYQVNNTDISDTDAETLSSAISRSKNNQNGNFNRSSVQIKNFNKLCIAYEDYKTRRNLIDFDDMIFYACDILEKFPEQRAYWARRYDFIQVDEAQDLTIAQFDIIRKIAPHQNIFVVADDDQSIYGFRGAQPSCLTDFTEKTRTCVKYHLSNNYRCASEIVDFSVNIISHNSNRFAKNPVAKKEDHGKIEILHTRNSYSQGKYIALTIYEKKQPCSIGILYRNNRSALSVAATLIHYNITFRTSGGVFAIHAKYINLFILECIKEQIRRESPSTLFKRVIDNGFRKKCMSKNKVTEQELENVDSALDFLHTVCNLATSFEQVRRLIQSVSDACSSGGYHGDILPQKEIFLSTIHSSKGLEYDTVFVIDINKDEFPGKSSGSGLLLEEERRLFYVAVTRAKKELYLLYTENYGMAAQEESIFIQEARAALKGV